MIVVRTMMMTIVMMMMKMMMLLKGAVLQLYSLFNTPWAGSECHAHATMKQYKNDA